MDPERAVQRDGSTELSYVVEGSDNEAAANSYSSLRSTMNRKEIDILTDPSTEPV